MFVHLMQDAENSYPHICRMNYLYIYIDYILHGQALQNFI